MRVFTTYQTATIVTKHGYKKIRPLKTQDGEFRYQIKGLTDGDYAAFEDENLTAQEVEDLLEDGGWILLDGFTAGGVKRVYEALNAENQSKFDRVPFTRIAAFTFAQVGAR
jgi:hypothetical protein